MWSYIITANPYTRRRCHGDLMLSHNLLFDVFYGTFITLTHCPNEPKPQDSNINLATKKCTGNDVVTEVTAGRLIALGGTYSGHKPVNHTPNHI